MKKFEKVLILTDMDGTLLNKEVKIAPVDGEAIDYFIENGGLFAVATGRAKRSVQNFLPALHTSAPSIVHNGSQIVDLRNDELIRVVNLGEVGRAFVEQLINEYPQIGIEVCLPDRQYVAHTNDQVERHLRRVGLVYEAMDHREIGFPWLKLNLLADPQEFPPVLELIRTQYADHLFGQMSVPHLCDVGAVGASKGDSAIWLRDWLGVRPEDFYTVGDGANDLELLLASGENSYAPQNAVELILQNASHILPDNSSGAIAALIAELDEKYR